MGKVTILIADDHPIIRSGLKNLFEDDGRFEVVAEADSGLTALSEVETHKPDIVIMDISMPGMDGIEATRRIRKEFPDTKVIILSMHHEKQYAIDAFRAGASGYVLKGSDPKEVLESVRRVLDDGLYASPTVADRLLYSIVDLIKKEQVTEPYDTLTDREREIFGLIADGEKNREIAERLCISVHTVKTHRVNIMNKLDVHDMAGLMRIAIKKDVSEG